MPNRYSAAIVYLYNTNTGRDTGLMDAGGVMRRVAWRVNVGVYLTKCVGPVAAVIVAFGVAFLLSRMLAPDFTSFTYLILALLPVVLLWAWKTCQRNGLFFNESDIVELVDHLSASDGMAATAYERPVLVGGGSVWSRIAAQLKTTPLRLDFVWFAWRLMPALIFAGAVFLVPPANPKSLLVV